MGIYERDYDTGSGWRDSYSGSPGGGFATWTANSQLLAVLVGAYILQNLIQGFTGWFELVPNLHLQPWRIYGLVTYSLLHDQSGLGHLLFNGIALYFFGARVNDRLGNREYFAFFFTGAVVAGLAWVATLLLSGGPPAALIGASGGISAILVLFALWYPTAKIYLWGILPVYAWVLVGVSVLGDALGFLNPGGSRIAYAAHLGGALFGFLYYRYRWRVSDWLPSEGFSPGDLLKFKRKPKLRVHRVSDDEAEAANPGEERVDEILRKIQAHGQDSLTREEQRVLERASRRYKNRRQ